MKTHKIIVVLLILLGMSAHTTTPTSIRAYESTNCTGEYFEAGSMTEIQRKNGKKKSDDDEDKWDFQSYNFSNNTDVCYPYNGGVGVAPTSPYGDNSDIHNGPLPTENDYGEFPPTAADHFGDEDNRRLLDCWLEKAAETDIIVNWEGEEGASFSTDAEIEWNVKNRTETLDEGETDNANTNWEVDADGNVTVTVNIYPHNIMKYHGLDSGIPLDHLVIAAQIEEMIHVWQGYVEVNDEDDQPIPWTSDKFAMEVEAKDQLAPFFKAIFNVRRAPYNVIKAKKLESYDSNREEFNDLGQKIERGENLSKSQIQRFSVLEEYFSLDVRYPYLKANKRYRKSTDLGCD